jgi:hypothetical protein
MEITELTAEQLQLQDSGLPGILIGAALSIAAVIWAIAVPLTTTRTVAAVLGVVGLFFIFSSSWDKISANKMSGQLFREEKRLFGKKESKLATTDVSHMEVRWKWAAQTDREASKSSTGPGLVSEVAMVLKDGKVWHLISRTTTSDESRISAFVGGKGDQYQLAGQVAQFFDVAVREVKL